MVMTDERPAPEAQMQALAHTRDADRVRLAGVLPAGTLGYRESLPGPVLQ
jgi:hypothetical protein